jgi:hypothetical protein
MATVTTPKAAPNTSTPFASEITAGARSPLRKVAPASTAKTAVRARSPARPSGYNPPAVSTARTPSSCSAMYGIVASTPVSATTSISAGESYRART